MQPTLINLHPNEYSQELHYYPFAVKLDRCAGCCSILNGSSNKVCFPNKTADLNLSVSNMITGINECLCKCKFDGRKHNSNQKCYNDKVDESVKNIIYVKKVILEILLKSSY